MKEISRRLCEIIAIGLLYSCTNTNSATKTGNETSGPPEKPDNTAEVQPFSTADVIPAPISIQPDTETCIPNSNRGSLPVTIKPQLANFWCWAACGEMSMESFGAAIDQCDEVNRKLNRNDCCGSRIPSPCDRGGWPQFEKYGFKSDTTHSAPLSWEQIKNQIDCLRKPICITWKWDGRNSGGHMMVVNAYKTLLGINQVRICDPLPVGRGSSRWIRYADYVKGPGYTHWDDFFNIRRDSIEIGN